MEIILDTIITYSFYAIAFVVPLILSSLTSEVFEFNKIVTVYILTTVIVASWIGKMVINRKFLFKKSFLDIPLLIFLSSQLISTVLSIDFRTSLLGYYSRFNGGLISSICYAFLYWAFVSNFNLRKTLNFLYLTFTSAVLVSLYGVLEHFGIDKHLWVQDVQTRVFSTLGQPNWLAAWIVALIPLNFTFLISSKRNSLRYWLWFTLSLLFFLVISYTKSRSGIIAFAVSDILFWGFIFIYSKLRNFGLKPYLITFFAIHFVLLILALTIDSPWRSMILSKFNKTQIKLEEKASSGPALEIGGTESGEIRKIVWKGAIDVWKRYSLFGSGVETFAFSYYEFRPSSHNLVSEWDFIYNKAHNEYLNYAATTGTFGVLAYIFVIAAILFLFIKIFQTENPNKINGYKLMIPALFSGFVSLLITNAVGFSVVPTSLQFFLFPAIAITLVESKMKNVEGLPQRKIETSQKITLMAILIAFGYVLLLISRYWLAEVSYAKAKDEIKAKDYLSARKHLIQSIKLSSSEAIYLNELGQVDGTLSLYLYDNKSFEEAKNLASISEQEEELAQKLSSRNLNIRREAASIYTKMSIIDSSFLTKANHVLTFAHDHAPTEPKIYLNLALSYFRLGNAKKAEEMLIADVDLKPNYKEARYALATIFASQKKKDKALEQLNYILKNIDPKDEASKILKETVEKGN